MNPIEFINNNYPAYLETKKNCKCRINLPDGTYLEGMFVGISVCDKLSEMQGFILDIPIYRLCVMHNPPEGGIEPVWVNTLLIDSMQDIIFM